MTSLSSRREFLRRAGWLGMAGAASPLALNLAALSAASAQAVGDDYRALVCLFMYGGNDNHNTVVPLDDTNHQRYQAIRSNIWLEQGSLRATELTPDNPWSAGRQMALHPALKLVHPLFAEGRMALVMNVGTLVRPISLDDYRAGIGLPPKLFSHNDQQSIWQSGLAEGASSGWGGRMADLMLDGNGDGALFTSVSAGGNAVMMAGRNAVQYQVSPAGSVQVNSVFGDGPATQALLTLMQRPSAHLVEQAHAQIASRSAAADARLRAALAGVGDFLPAGTGRLAPQLNIVARLIAARAQLGVKRQVFFVSLGGFDHHDGLIERQNALLAEVGSGMKAFYDATVAMGVQHQVTTFTGSDFGRTLASNGDGSDHGWGSYHLVVGGGVLGRRWVGQLPDVAVNGAHDVGGGRLLPQVSVDQYGASLGRWLGVPSAQLAGVFPHLSQFDRADLGLMVA